jgi:hypothetical protein
MLRTPLERKSGALRADTASYAPELVAAVSPSTSLPSAERLAVYHRQYWFRLLTVLQDLHPLTARLMGYWRFNDYAAAHLLERAPSGYDLDTVGDGFVQTLSERLPPGGCLALDNGQTLQVASLLEAANIDAEFHRVARAPVIHPFRPGAADAAQLGVSRLLLSPAVSLLREHWPLCQLRLSFLERPPQRPPVLGEPWSEPRHWLLTRHASQLGLVGLEAHEARLFLLLQAHPLEQALALLEAELSDDERRDLPLRAQAWLARSVRVGMWAGMVEANA